MLHVTCYLLYDQLDDAICAGLVGPDLQVVKSLLRAEGRQVVRNVEDLLHGVRLVQGQETRLVFVCWKWPIALF